jgi:hypothetical protein
VSGNVVHIGNKSDAPVPVDYVSPTGYPVVTQKYTYAELEAGLAAGNVIGVVNGEIIYATPVFIPKPVIISTKTERNNYGHVQLTVFIEKTNEPNISHVDFLYYEPRFQSYQSISPTNWATATKDGYVNAGPWNPLVWKSVNIIVRFAGKNGAAGTSSQAVTVDLTTLGVNNNLLVQTF